MNKPHYRYVFCEYSDLSTYVIVHRPYDYLGTRRGLDETRLSPFARIMPFRQTSGQILSPRGYTSPSRWLCCPLSFNAQKMLAIHRATVFSTSKQGNRS